MFLNPPPPPPSLPPVTVWVHGTKVSAIFPTDIAQKIQKTAEAITYCPQGLHKVSTINPKYNVHSIATTLSQADQQQFPLETFYAFGWNGELDFTARKLQAANLYEQLGHLTNSYKATYHTRPPITLITHSHGGNVALNLAEIATSKNDIVIDRLIMLACPVQKETMSKIQHPIFKKVYSIYSYGDMVQILDPQGIHPLKSILNQVIIKKSFEPIKKAYQEVTSRPLFSRRHFPPHEKLAQAAVKWTVTLPWNADDIALFPEIKNFLIKATMPLRRPHDLLHVEFVIPSFFKQLPRILTYIDRQSANKPRNTSGNNITIGI